MKPEIKALLSYPQQSLAMLNNGRVAVPVITTPDFEAWLDKLTEGASFRYGNENGFVLHADWREGKDTHKFLTIPLGEIKKQTPLEIALRTLKSLREYASDKATQKFIDETLAQIEAAK